MPDTRNTTIKRQTKYLWITLATLGTIGLLALSCYAWGSTKKYHKTLTYPSQKECQKIIPPTNYTNTNDMGIKKPERSIEEIPKSQQAFRKKATKDLDLITQDNQKILKNPIEDIENKMRDSSKQTTLQAPHPQTSPISQKANATPSSAQADSTATQGKSTPTKAVPLSFTYTVEKIPTQKHQTTKQDDKIQAFRIPYSVARGITISGGNANTITAEEDELPIEIKITSNPILINNQTLAMKGCFLSAIGRGNLAQKRVLIRPVYINCIYEDRNAKLWLASGKVEGYITDENGMNGIAGEIIEKNNKFFKASIENLEMLLKSYKSMEPYAASKLADIYINYLQAMQPSILIKPLTKVNIIFQSTEKILLTPYTRGLSSATE